MKTLNVDQKAALKKMQLFLVDEKEKFFCLNAPSGYGKTWLTNVLIRNQKNFTDKLKILGCNDFKYHNIELTATTNKAVTLLDDSQTIFKLIGIKPTWGNKLTDRNAKHIFNTVLLIDEASYISDEMFKYIAKYCAKCKVIFIGDECQLKCVGSSFSVFEQGFPSASLTIPMRQDPDSDLFKLCQHLRDCVKKGITPTWFRGEDIYFYNDAAFGEEIVKAFTAKENCKVLAYENTQVDAYNDGIMQALNQKSIYDIGSNLIAKKYVQKSANTLATYPEQSITVKKVEDAVLQTVFGALSVKTINDHYHVPQSSWYYTKVAEAKAKRNWPVFYDLNESYHEFRLGHSLTTFKSQGSTYDKVFLDLRNIDTCKELDQKLRQTYVGVSRASKEIHIYV